ncbi:group II intron reverse transcriptase/maturase [Sorangium sp. So ce861]|uniref:group II intron reverse transcriptase/maturase n=1 Tax=Sorangium sp. So ce861 TaxID=3133323 RepID=UPI003F643DA7
MTKTPSSITISTKLERIAMAAREAPGMAFTTLAHHLDLAWLQEAYRRTRKDGATGVDRQTAEQYAANLEGNLRSLLDRAKSGTYRAPPVRRVHIPKGGSGTETRPIGIPTFEDKVLQRAVAMVLEAVYEQDFLDCSYGFRPGRSAHQALQALWLQATRHAGGWILDVDVRKFFDTLDHGRLREILRRRVLDGVLLRLIDKWLAAGVLENGGITYPDSGSPQGGVVSPILANIYLHEVLDTWFDREVKPRLSGRAQLVRYADDAVLLFAYERDARRVMAVLPKRFGKYGLTLHPEKTRLIEFRRPDRRAPPVRVGASPRPGTFELLGFTHYWGRSRSGKWIVRRSTAKDRFRRALRRIAEWCREHLHDDLRAQQQALAQKLRGHYGYFGITGNSDAVERFRYEVTCAWRRWLDRRSQRARVDWARMNDLLKRYPLPQPSLSPIHVSRAANP